MASFKDANGKTWTVSLDAPLINTVRKECQLNLADLDGKSYERMVDDPVLLVNVLWVLCREQATAANFTEVQFGRALVGDIIDHATTAMLESIVDFFPKTRRELLKAVTAKTDKIRQIGMAKALEKINDPELEAQVVAEMESRMDAAVRESLTRLQSATNSPGSLASVPEA